MTTEVVLSGFHMHKHEYGHTCTHKEGKGSSMGHTMENLRQFCFAVFININKEMRKISDIILQELFRTKKSLFINVKLEDTAKENWLADCPLPRDSAALSVSHHTPTTMPSAFRDAVCQTIPEYRKVFKQQSQDAFTMERFL